MKILAAVLLSIISINFLSCSLERDEDILLAYLVQKDRNASKGEMPYLLSEKDPQPSLEPNKQENKASDSLNPKKVLLGEDIDENMIVERPLPIKEAPLPQYQTIDSSIDEPLFQTNSASNEDVLHPQTVTHYNDVHRYQNHHHHHNTNNIYHTHHRYQTRIFDHKSQSQSFSETSEFEESAEIIPEAYYSAP